MQSDEEEEGIEEDFTSEFLKIWPSKDTNRLLSSLRCIPLFILTRRISKKRFALILLSFPSPEKVFVYHSMYVELKCFYIRKYYRYAMIKGESWRPIQSYMQTPVRLLLWGGSGSFNRRKWRFWPHLGSSTGSKITVSMWYDNPYRTWNASIWELVNSN